MDNKERKTKRTAAQAKAEAEYRKKRTGKTVFFNTETEQHLIDAANNMPNFSGWVKANLESFLEQKQYGK